MLEAFIILKPAINKVIPDINPTLEITAIDFRRLEEIRNIFIIFKELILKL